jgi:2,3-bisphosphoglycerate-independent phosphoglycerate mutase
MSEKAALVILDGWGIGRHDRSDAIWNAKTPFTDMLWDTFPHASLRTDGEHVGLPEGQMGNSEVGHMNIGAGRIVWQMLVRINKAFSDGSISENTMLQKVFACKGNLHLMGLVSDGGVHSHIDHAIALGKMAAEAGVKNVFIHAFLDGRDTDPKSGLNFIKRLQNELNGTGVTLSTAVGRYYAMDRDKRWERVKKAYDLMVNGVGEYVASAEAGIAAQYEAGITDEFMEPLRFLPGSEGLICEGDTVLCFNFRTDRGRQITRALSQENFPDQGMRALSLDYYTLTEYDETFKIAGVIFENQNLTDTLGDVLSGAGKTQLRAAETEKYPHVTFFFSGGREEPFLGEERIMAASPKVATYDLQPEMSAHELTQNAIAFLEEKQPDFICLNFANPDMVGHTGVFNAIVKACETVDDCLRRLVEVGLKHQYHFLIIADHGNADMAVNEDGSPNTAHTTNPVPCWLVSQTINPHLHNGILADVAPTILKMMQLPQPTAMTGRALF